MARVSAEAQFPTLRMCHQPLKSSATKQNRGERKSEERERICCTEKKEEREIKKRKNEKKGKMDGLGMNKRRVVLGGKNKMNMIRRKQKKKTKRSLFMKGIVKFLKSDSFFYSPLLSFDDSSSNPPLDFLSPTPGFEANKPVLEDEGKSKNKLVKYLTSDTYLYAPLGDSQPPQQFATKTVISPPKKGQELMFKTVTSTYLSNKIAWQTEHRVEDAVSEKRIDNSTKSAKHDANVGNPQTPVLKEIKKPMNRRSYRISTNSGNEVLSR